VDLLATLSFFAASPQQLIGGDYKVNPWWLCIVLRTFSNNLLPFLNELAPAHHQHPAHCNELSWGVGIE
jgi:hypothetical protein